MINSPKLPINDEARNDAHIASTGAEPSPESFQ